MYMYNSVHIFIYITYVISLHTIKTDNLGDLCVLCVSVMGGGCVLTYYTLDLSMSDGIACAYMIFD